MLNAKTPATNIIYSKAFSPVKSIRKKNAMPRNQVCETVAWEDFPLPVFKIVQWTISQDKGTFSW
jgi:hypothetical protein